MIRANIKCDNGRTVQNDYHTRTAALLSADLYAEHPNVLYVRVTDANGQLIECIRGVVACAE